MKDCFTIKQLPPTAKKKAFTLKTFWNGYFFKNLQINIDFVPAFKYSYQKDQTRQENLRKESANSHIFAVCKHDDFNVFVHSLLFSYSLYERDLLQALPMHVKNGYRLAKAVRHTEVCPNVQLSDATFALVDGCIMTYMLKTCLLHTMKEFEQNHLDDTEWLSPLSIKWAIKIYEQMKFFLKIFEGKIPNY